ncbi:histone-lysine N-methyltransferase EHMT2 [Lutzomyia longipalpis]|uniref:histone-lysine N-methyltransferase EHMT2 n=1 Tax=Lutzomyia longipalpis TaxID=7200 RepID=UPI002483EB22|nr:histone-lysine N-methyltransferase EHMT2 [Lutzomyia longipalpis]
MAEFIDSLLNEMSSTFNYQTDDVKIDLNRDRTLKWRSLHHNQYASTKKKSSRVGRNEEGSPYQSVKVFRNPLSNSTTGLKKLRRAARMKLSRLERNLRRKAQAEESPVEEKPKPPIAETTNIHVNYIAGDCALNLIDMKPENVQIFQGASVKVERRTSRRSTEKPSVESPKKSTPKKMKKAQENPESSQEVSRTEGTLLSQRPPRRVKPTEKILANKRLRRGIQIHNTKVKVTEALWRERENLATAPISTCEGDTTAEKPQDVVQEAEMSRKTQHLQQLGLTTITQVADAETERMDPEEKIAPPEAPAGTMVCLCQEETRFFPHAQGEALFCNAVDQFETEFVGCCNQVDESTCIRRPSTRACFMVLCDSHRKRLLSHNCCSGCGVFCTRGQVLLCPRNHFFHRDCVLDEGKRGEMVMCLHCGDLTETAEVRIELKCDNRIVFYPSQKTFLRCTKTPAVLFSADGQISGETPTEGGRTIPQHIMNTLIRASQQAPAGSPQDGLSPKNLQAAIKNDDIDRVAEYIVKGFDFTAPCQEFGYGSCLHYVSYFGTVEVLQLILCRFAAPEFIDMLDKEFQTALMCAVSGSKIDILLLLLQYGAKVTQKGPDGMTALHLAAKTGNFRATKILLEHYKKKVDRGKFMEFLNDVDHGNWTALVWAAELGHVNIESYLIGLGADVTICDFENNTALHWAAQSNKIAAIVPLLHTNANLNHQNVNGDTPLHIACRQLNTQMCLMLLANGSDVHVKNFTEETAIACIPDAKSQCARIMQFNMQMQRNAIPVVQELCSDISNGREAVPIAMVKITRRNPQRRTEDTEWEVPMPAFKYITKPVMVEELIQMDIRLARMEMCDCRDNCATSLCKCIRKSSQNCYTLEGRLCDDFSFTEPSIIFECNDVCGCNRLVCKNRIVQNGIKVPMEVFSVGDKKEWGVRCLKEIPKGTFIAEYIGEMLSNADADRRPDDSYFFGFDLSEYCIDANFFGNVSRFFNHSCNPNMVPIRVYFEHHDLRFPKIAFFSTRDIAAKDELTFDYGKNFWKVKQRYFNCNCNTPECRYRTKLPSPDLDQLDTD